MTARLLRDEIAHHLAALQQQSTLTALQSARLAAILDTLADDGRFLLRAALEAAEFPAGDARGKDAFQEFRCPEYRHTWWGRRRRWPCEVWMAVHTNLVAHRPAAAEQAAPRHLLEDPAATAPLPTGSAVT